MQKNTFQTLTPEQLKEAQTQGPKQLGGNPGVSLEQIKQERSKPPQRAIEGAAPHIKV